MQTRFVGGSAAYDLSRFEPSRRARQSRPKLVVASPSVKARARARLAAALKTVAVLAVLAAVVVATLYSRAVLTELNCQISDSVEELRNLESEQTRLSAELESKISLRNVEEYATQTLGMAPLNKDQITYVNLSDGDRIELTASSPKPTFFERIKLAITNVKTLLPQDEG